MLTDSQATPPFLFLLEPIASYQRSYQSGTLFLYPLTLWLHRAVLLSGSRDWGLYREDGKNGLQ